MAESADAVVIGAGINALVCAAILARAGWSVAVCEQGDAPGGAIRTRTDVFPGYVVEVLSSWHPLFVGGPAYALLGDELTRRGLTYLNTARPTGVACADGSAVLHTDPAAAAAEFTRLGDDAAWAELVGDFGAKADLAFGALGLDFWNKRALGFAWKARRHLGTAGSLAMGAELLRPAAPWLEASFASPVSRALLAPWALHNGLGPDDAGSAFITKAIAFAIATGGMPVPVGGGKALVDALVGIVTDSGGEVLTGAEVVGITVADGRATGVTLADGRAIGAGRAVLAGVTPNALYARLLCAAAPGDRVRAARAFRHGRAAMQIHLALSEPAHWKDPTLDEVALVHVLDGVGSLSESVNAAWRGYLPARPTVAVGQPAAVDRSRVPDGKGLLWVQLQELPRRVRGDAAAEIATGDGTWTPGLRDAYSDRVLDQVTAQLQNPDAITDRVVLGPAELEALNPNLVGGDPYGGDCRLDQYGPWRPLNTGTGHNTGIAQLWHIGASTHPGPGLGGGSGYLVAQKLLARRRPSFRR